MASMGTRVRPTSASRRRVRRGESPASIRTTRRCPALSSARTEQLPREDEDSTKREAVVGGVCSSMERLRRRALLRGGLFFSNAGGRCGDAALGGGDKLGHLHDGRAIAAQFAQDCDLFLAWQAGAE